MKIIVTGATGFIGTALCRELLENGHEVVAVVRPGSKKRDKLRFGKDLEKRLSVMEISLENLPLLKEKAHRMDIFYHLAWNGASGSDRENFDIQYSNIGYTAAAIRAAAACGCHKFVGAGSQAEYGVVCGTAKEEETVPAPFMMYGAAKLAAYHMGRLVAQQEQIGFVWPRIYSVYGVGENPGTLIDYVMESLLKGEIPQLTSCDNKWNFMYIDDCVELLRLLGEKEEAEGVYHVASEDTRLLKEFVMEIKNIIAPEGKLGFGKKETDIKRTFWLEPDVKRLEAMGMGCRTPFSEGIRKKLQKVIER